MRTEMIADILESIVLVNVRYRKDLGEDALQAPEFSLGGRNVGLEEIIIGRQLHIEQIGHFRGVGQRPICLACYETCLGQGNILHM